MKKKATALLASILVTCTSYAIAFDVERERELLDISRDACASEPKNGYIFEKGALGNGDIEVKIIGKKGIALNGGFFFKEKEWSERPKVRTDHQADADTEYRECVKYWLDRYKSQDQLNDIKKK